MNCWKCGEKGIKDENIECFWFCVNEECYINSFDGIEI